MKVSVELNFDTGLHTLMVTDGRLSPAPAGARLFHGGDGWPDNIQFAHESVNSAQADRARLQKYLDGLAVKKKGEK